MSHWILENYNFIGQTMNRLLEKMMGRLVEDENNH